MKQSLKDIDLSLVPAHCFDKYLKYRKYFPTFHSKEMHQFGPQGRVALKLVEIVEQLYHSHANRKVEFTQEHKALMLAKTKNDSVV